MAIRVEATVSPKVERIRLATLRNGKARRALQETLQEAFLQKSIPDQNHSGPADKQAPELAVVMSDGGRYQRFDRGGGKTESGSFWKESRLPICRTSCRMSASPKSSLTWAVLLARTLSANATMSGRNRLGSGLN